MRSQSTLVWTVAEPTCCWAHYPATLAGGTLTGGGVITPSAPVAVEQEPFSEALQYRISGDSRVRLLFDGAVTREAIEKLMAYLELAKEDYPSREQLAQPVVEQSTIIEMPESDE
jgi:hypothetical protein